MKRKQIYSYTMTLLAAAIAASLSPAYASSTTGPTALPSASVQGAADTRFAEAGSAQTPKDGTAKANAVAQVAPSGSSADAAKTTSASKSKAIDLNTITVHGQLAALRQEAATKRDAVGVVDSISAEEAGKFPDQNVADALQRVPGVSVDRGGGESNQITVRGFGPSFVNVLLNGRIMSSASTDRSFVFDALPSEIIQSAVVHKTGSAELPAGGIGGTVNIITARPSDFKGFHASGTVSGVNDHIGSGLSAKTTPKFSAMIGDSNSSGTFGWLASVLYDKRDHVEQSVDAQGWMTGLDYTQFDPAYTNVAMPQTLQYTVTHTSSTRKAVNGAIDWSPTDNLKVTFDTMLSRYDVTSKYDAFGQYSNTDNVQSLSADPNGTILKYTQFNTGLMANDYIEGSTPRKETNEQTGPHVTYRINDSTEVDWDIADSKAWNKGAANGYIAVIGTRNVGVNPVFTNNGSSLLPSYSNILPTTDMSNLHAHVQQYGADNPDVSNKILENRIHLSKTFLSGVLTQLDFGVEATSQSKKQVGYITPNTFGCLEYCGYTANIPADAVGAHVINVGSLVSGVSPGSPTQWIAYDANKLFAYLASPAAYNQRPDPAAFAATLAANGGGFAARPDLSTYSKVREQIESAYAKANLQGSLGDMPWTLDLGMRYTKTITRPSAYSVPVLSIYVNPNDTSNAIPTYGTETAISDKGSYSNWLPSASFKLNLRDNLIFRLALSKTLTRPDLSSLADSVSYNFLPNSQEINMGNPNLKPYTSKNVDAGLEWYFNDTSYVALDGFYKDVGNFITTITTGETFLGFPFQVTRPVNLNSAKVKGAEFTFNYQISDMNGFFSAFNGFGVATNYTYVTSSASISPAEIASGALFAIPGIGNSANVSGYYDKGPIELRLAYNWRASYLETLADDEGNPLSVKAYGQLDFSSSYRINRHVSLFLDMTNLTNETINKYEVYLNRQDYAEANGRTMYFGVRASL